MGSEPSIEFRPLLDCTSDSKISYGVVQPGSHDEGGVPIVRVNNFSDGRLNLTSPIKVHPEIEKKHSRTRLLGGEVLLSLVGSTGQSAIAGPELAGWNVARAVAVIRPSEEFSATWIHICLQTPEVKHFLDSRANTTVQKTLNLKDVCDIPILRVKKSKMDFIETCWSAFSDKIELNRQMNATLEGMAQALFKSWFVDFDPVIDNALAAGNPIPEELADRAEVRRAALADGTANREAAKPFPAGFQHSEELGWIPEGWEVGEIRELCENIQNGGTPKKDTEEYWESGTIPWLTSGEVRQSLITEAQKTITEAGLKGSSAKWVSAGSTVVAMYGATAGQVAYITCDLTTNQAVCALIPKAHYSHFNYLSVETKVKHFENQARGSAQQNISKGIIESSLTVLPNFKMIELYEEYATKVFDKWTSNLILNKSLTKLRDTLLPKLISGELRIPDAEKLAEKALA